MKNPACYFEIPVRDLDRAVQFYQQVFGYRFERTTIDGNAMAIFPSADGGAGITGALAKGESYVPGRQGARVYFSVETIDDTLKRATDAGAKVLDPKTRIADGSGDELGWVAEIEDSEGNCIAMHAVGGA